MGRVIAWEHPELWGGLIDLDRPSDASAAQAIRRETVSRSGEDQVAYRAGKRYVARLVSDREAEPAPGPALEVLPEASYLVTGGLGSLGLHVAGWLVERGARHLVLLGRAGPRPEALAKIAAMEERGAEVRVASCDAASAGPLASLLGEVGRTMPPLRGVIHLAGVLDDGVLMKQNPERFRRVMAPKVAGSWNLHALTSDCPLDFFVLFSSVASLLGSPGQANYAAGNAFMDALAQHRRLRGLPGVSVNWGPWADAGMAADLARRSGRRWIPEGVDALSVAEGLSALTRVLPQGGPQLAVMPVDWSRFLGQFPAGSEPRVLAQILARVGRAAPPGGEVSRPRIREDLREAPAGERRALLIAYLQKKTAEVMRLPGDDLPDPDQGLFEMGLDSLMAVELKNILVLAAGKDLPASLIFSFPNIAALADFLLGELVPVAAAASAPAEGAVRPAPVAPDGTGGPGEDELMDLLAAEIQASQHMRAQAAKGA
jgi:NAD(P)-dependent dehydrogenase (short-subunit alcohol dehydrogenase family)/acyl carrier protein